jgi:hypothetical protein
MDLLLWIRCLLRGGHNPDTVMVTEYGWTEFGTRVIFGRCAVCGAETKMHSILGSFPTQALQKQDDA